MKVILQTTQSDCLIACAAMIMSKYRCNVPVYRLLEKIQNSTSGSNVLQLRETMDKYGFMVNGYRVELHQINNKMLPLVAYVNENHFVVIEHIGSQKIHVIDPAIGKITHDLEEFSKSYSGVVISINPSSKNVQRRIDNRNLMSMFKNRQIASILIGLFFSSIFSQVVAMSYSYMYSLVSKDDSLSKLFLLVMAVVVILGASSLVKGKLMKQFNIVYEVIYGNVMTDRLVSKNYKFFSIRNNGDLLYRINARGVIKDSVLMKIVPAIISSVTVVVVIIMLYINNTITGILLAVISVFYVILLIMTGMQSYGLSNAYTQKNITLNTTTENIVRSIATIKVLDVSQQFVEKWKKENLHQAQAYGKLITLQSIQEILSNIYTYLIPIVISLIGIIFNKEAGIQQLALLPLLYLVVQNVSTVGMAFVSLYAIAPTVNKTNELLDAEYMKERPIEYKKLTGDNVIEIKDLSYYYDSTLCLSDININIKRGEKIAVLGLSGSGKSTLLKIIANLLCDYKGNIYFDDLCRERPIYLDQDTCIIDGTILENIAFGQTIEQEKLDKVAQITGLDKIVNEQPLGWGTKISKGKNLSKGQEQRICLARCLMKESSIYLFDEATSNIDVIDEEVIINNLFNRYEELSDKNILISTHKLNIIKYVDKIIFVSNHKVHIGTHNELLESIPEYGELMRH